MPFIQKVIGGIIFLTLTVFIVLFGALPRFRSVPSTTKIILCFFGAKLMDGALSEKKKDSDANPKHLLFFRRTPIGWAHKLVMSYLPNGLAKLDTMLTGGVVFRSVERLANYLFYEKHPLIQVRSTFWQ